MMVFTRAMATYHKYRKDRGTRSVAEVSASVAAMAVSRSRKASGGTGLPDGGSNREVHE